ncbi:aminotransferase class V-fold PLP-dependent enzyme [Candidatus Thorarchaeota archaeon]|nr:MAG: aminotransferase class V-fold PLP-dependent enzyme [Candidatus Thorarchaeota archaeon]
MPRTIDPAFISAQFPTLSQMTYLNNASTGIPPRWCIEAMQAYLDDRTHAIGDFEKTLKTFTRITKNLANLLGGSKEQYGFVGSTSMGLNSIAHAIEYPEGSNIVICDLEFPSNYIPWQNVSRLLGVELRVAETSDGAAPASRFQELVDENTRVVAVSHVQFGTGYRSDLEELAHIAHESDAILVADIIQSAGWADIDLKSWGVDFAAAQAAKWLVGPIGAGFVYVSNRIMDDLKPRFMGWWGVKDIADFTYFERESLPDARMFQIGSPAMVAYVGFLASLEVLLKLDASTREEAAMQNADYLRARLDELEIPYYDFGESHNSPIVSSAPDDVEEIQKRLAKEKIHCSVRNGRLRVSPHFYNTTHDIDRLAEHLG